MGARAVPREGKRPTHKPRVSEQRRTRARLAYNKVVPVVLRVREDVCTWSLPIHRMTRGKVDLSLDTYGGSDVGSWVLLVDAVVEAE